MRIDRSDMPRVWALQVAVLALSAVVVFWGFFTLDHVVAQHSATEPGGAFGGPFGPLQRYFAFDPESVMNSISALSGINTAVFGIVLTVVSIIVQLTADRYTGVARMFLRDPVNIIVPAYYVVACVVSVWLALSSSSTYVPVATIAAVLSMTTGGLIIMGPYFSYVFWFLEPRHIIDRVREEAVQSAREGALEHDEQSCFDAQAQTLFALEELTDITNNSISGKDKIIASRAVDALKDLTLEYLKVKPRASEAWFSIGPEIRLNPDFVAMDPESLTELQGRRTWIEWKVMRQYLSIYNEALGSMRDINYLIAIDTRYIGEAAVRAEDTQLIELVFRYYNSYIRSALNGRDVRTCYNVLNQYRKLLEFMLRHGNHKAALAGLRHIKYYGLASFEMGLNFVTETVAYDMSALAQLANELASPADDDFLTEFLELDRPSFARSQEKALLGVRKAQTKLAAYYLASGQEQRARAIADDMRDESQERLRLIHQQLAAVESKEFWEIVDRGRNFEYMPPEHRARLGAFFDWLRAEADAPAAPD
ncbi:MAG TPA: hypothetical protein VG841_01515 [Caulobacterales bacterium]|nr:hypothetical protein [Caulobacterales bacterium]